MSERVTDEPGKCLMCGGKFDAGGLRIILTDDPTEGFNFCSWQCAAYICLDRLQDKPWSMFFLKIWDAVRRWSPNKPKIAVGRQTTSLNCEGRVVNAHVYFVEERPKSDPNPQPFQVLPGGRADSETKDEPK